MPFEIIRNDITKMKTDAVVNTAGPLPEIGQGTDSAIHEAAGPRLLKARQKIGRIAPGIAALTKGYHLPAKYVIHTVGPVWKGGQQGETELLENTYLSCLRLAAAKKLRSVAFPLISAGTYGFPKDIALKTAVNAVSRFLLEEDRNDMTVYLTVYGRTEFTLSEKLFQSVQSYIDDRYVEEHAPAEQDTEIIQARRRRQRAYERESVLYEDLTADISEAGPDPRGDAVPAEKNPDIADELHLPEDFYSVPDMAPAPGHYFGELPSAASATAGFRTSASRAPAPSREKASVPAAGTAAFRPQDSLEERIRHMDDTFSQSLLRIIDQKGKKDSDVYKRANIDRKLFSKIRSNPHYRPGKQTALALAIALELNLDETKDLLGRAGIALTRSSRFDIIVEYFIEQKNYNIFEINEVLFAFDEPTIGA